MLSAHELIIEQARLSLEAMRKEFKRQPTLFSVHHMDIKKLAVEIIQLEREINKFKSSR